MKVVIYETKFSSPFSITVSATTGSGYSHGAILNNDVLYDTTFKRGKFAIADKVDPNRKVAVVDIEGDCQEWIDANLDTLYDLLGLIGWPLAISISDRMYCFNVVEEALDSLGIYMKLGWRKDGGTILSSLLEKGYKVELMMGSQFNERYLK